MKMVPLGEIASLGSGGTPKRSVSSYFGNDYPWLSIADLNDGFVTDAKEGLTTEGLNNSSAKLVAVGSILIAMYGSIGKLGISQVELCTSQAIAFATPHPDIVDRRYLFHFLLSERSSLQRRGRGGTQQNISQGDLKAWRVPLPPLDEQRRIAAILDKADAIRQKRRQAIAHLDTLTQFIFRDMFGATEAPTSRLGDSLEFLTSGSRGWARYYSNNGDLFLRIQNVGYGQLILDDLAHVLAPKTAEARRTKVEPGDVLVSITADLGRSAVIPDGIGTAFINQHLAILRAPSMNPRFLSTYLTNGDGYRQLLKKNRGATKSGLNFDDIRSVKIPIPGLQEQNAFASRLAGIDSLTGRYRSLLRQHNDLFASLQSRAFKGEL